MRVLPSERSLSTAPEGAPLPDGTSETLRHQPRRGRRLCAGRPPHHLRRRRALPRQGVLSSGRDGVRGRHHAVTGREPSWPLQNSPRGSGRADRHRRRRSRGAHGRLDLVTADGVEHAAARARRAAEGQTACLRSPARALAGAAGHDRRARHIDIVSDAEIRMGPADAGIPVADLHGISACSSQRCCCSSRAGKTCAAR